MKNWKNSSRSFVNTALNKHILIISYYFPPMGGGGVQRIVKLLKYWDTERHNISVLTVKPSFFYAEDLSLSSELHQNFSLYRSGTLDPFRMIHFLKIFFYRKKDMSSRESSGFMRKLVNFFLLPDSRIFWLPFALVYIYRIHRKRRVDLVLATMPPFTTGIIARWALRLFNIPYLLDFRDAWTQNPYLPAISPFHNRIQALLEEKVYRSAHATVFVNPNLADYYLDRYAVPDSRRSSMIRNGYDPVDFDFPMTSAGGRKDEYFRIGIVGSIYSQGNAPKTLLRAVQQLRKDNPRIEGELKIVFLGKWSPDFLEFFNSLDLGEIVEWIPYKPHRQALEMSNQMDALALAINSRLPGSENVTPGRIYEYLYLRKPVLATCHPQSDIARLLVECDAGMAVDYRDICAIKGILTDWLNRRNSLKREFSFRQLEQFDRKQIARKYMAFIDDIFDCKSE